MLTTRFRDEWSRELRLRAAEQADPDRGGYLYRPPGEDNPNDDGYDTGGYCCLGIATCHVIRDASLASESVFTEFPSHLSGGEPFAAALAAYHFPQLSAIVDRLAGRDAPSHGEEAFAAMNDGGWSFHRIANVIEHLPTDDLNGYNG